MSVFFKRAADRICKYKRKYIHHPRFAALKLAIWSFGESLKRKISIKYIYRKFFSKNAKNRHDNDDKIWILFDTRYGIGDSIIGANYIWHFAHFINDPRVIIDVLSPQMPFASAIFHEHSYINNLYYYEDDCPYDTYNLVILLRRFPSIVHMANVKIFNANLNAAIKTFQSSPISDPGENAILQNTLTDSRANTLCRIKGLKRIQQPDITQLFKVGTDYKAPIFIDTDEDECLKKFGLLGKKFITFSRECGQMLFDAESTKMWPLSHYDRLVKLLKQETNEYKIVQIGSSTVYSKLIENIDIDLRGKTSLEEVKVILRHSSLHIDNDSGMVHLRHALHAGPSVVMFGPTDIDIYGYPENINIKSKNCHCFPCEWITSSWNLTCINTDNPHICMRSIKPEDVMKEIREKFLKKQI